MAWLVGIIVAIIAIRFWRISLPLLGIAAVGIGGMLLYEQNQSEQRKQAREDNKANVAQKIREARDIATDTGREWAMFTMDDPASGQAVPRLARIQSNDGLCWLTVEKRISGSELTGLQCELLEIPSYKDIDVKFDNYENSNTMRLDSYSDSDGVFIPSNQYSYSNQLPYDEFIRRLGGGKAVAIRIQSSNAGTHWITFTLNGSSEALGVIYGEQ